MFVRYTVEKKFWSEKTILRQSNSKLWYKSPAHKQNYWNIYSALLENTHTKSFWYVHLYLHIYTDTQLIIVRMKCYQVLQYGSHNSLNHDWQTRCKFKGSGVIQHMFKSGKMRLKIASKTFLSWSQLFRRIDPELFWLIIYLKENYFGARKKCAQV